MAYGFYASITTDNTKVGGSANLTNYRMLVSGTYDGTGGEPDIRTTGNGGNIQNTDATGGITGSLTVPADLVFSPNTDGSTPYDFEFEGYSASTGEIRAWVEIPSLTYSSDFTFYMVYGDSAVTTSQENIAGVHGANQSAVWHLENHYLDSSGNGNTLVNGNAPDYTASGHIGGAFDFTKGNSDYLKITDANRTGLDFSTTFTASAWLKIETLPNNNAFYGIYEIGGALNGAWAYSVLLATRNSTELWLEGLVANGASYDFYQGDISPPSTTGTFQLFTMTVDVGNPSATTFEFFLNGVSYGNGTAQNSGNISSISDSSSDMIIGARNAGGLSAYIDGIMDELVMYSDVKTAGWLLTDYNSQNSPSTFYTMGSEVGGGGGIAASRRSIQA